MTSIMECHCLTNEFLQSKEMPIPNALVKLDRDDPGPRQDAHGVLTGEEAEMGALETGHHETEADPEVAVGGEQRVKARVGAHTVLLHGRTSLSQDSLTWSNYLRPMRHKALRMKHSMSA